MGYAHKDEKPTASSGFDIETKLDAPLTEVEATILDQVKSALGRFTSVESVEVHRGDVISDPAVRGYRAEALLGIRIQGGSLSHIMYLVNDCLKMHSWPSGVKVLPVTLGGCSDWMVQLTVEYLMGSEF